MLRLKFGGHFIGTFKTLIQTETLILVGIPVEPHNYEILSQNSDVASKNKKQSLSGDEGKYRNRE